MNGLIIMPFARKFDAVHAMIKSCVADVNPTARGQVERVDPSAYGEQTINVYALRLDEVGTAGKITTQLIEALRGADFYIADITDQNSNVMWEVGFASAVGRPIIFITQATGALPFDIKDERVVRYNRRNLEGTLYAPLLAALRQTIARYSPVYRRVLVTGTGMISRERARVMLLPILAPYMGQQTMWYCGVNGTTDEAAIEILATRGEHVTPMYDQIYKMTPESSRLIKVYELQPSNADEVIKEIEMHEYDVSSPDIPTVYVGTDTTNRLARLDSSVITYCLRVCDLLILLGNENDGRTGKLVGQAQHRRRPYLLAYA